MYRVHRARIVAADLRVIRDFREAIVQAHASKLIRKMQVQHQGLVMCSPSFEGTSSPTGFGSCVWRISSFVAASFFSLLPQHGANFSENEEFPRGYPKLSVAPLFLGLIQIPCISVLGCLLQALGRAPRHGQAGQGGRYNPGGCRARGLLALFR